MSSIVHLPEQFKIVQGSLGAVTAQNGFVGDHVSLKNINMAWIVLHFDMAGGFAVVINPMKATLAVGAVGSTAITHNAPNWMNADCAATDTLVRGADATTVTLGAGVANHMVVIQIDPAQLGDTFDCMGCNITTGAGATDLVSIMYNLETRYGQALPPTAILD
jgi:hypothetical protein